MLVFYTLTCGGVFLLAFLLIANSLQVNRLANRWLAIVLLCFGCALLDRILPGTWLDAHYPVVRGLAELTRLAMAPALYLSVVQFTAPSRSFRARDLGHFLPWLLFLGYAAPLLGRWSWLPAVPPSPALRTVVFYSTKMQAVVYWGLAYWQLVRHQRHVRLLMADVAAIDLTWLRYLLLGLALLVGLWLNEVFFQVSVLLALMPAGYLAATFALGYFALRQREVFAYAPAARAEVATVLHAADAAPNPIRQPRLPAAHVQAIQQKLTHLMTTERVFLEPDLSLPTLAQRAGVSIHELSYVLNEGLGENFFQFVNRYRVEEAKRLLVSAQHRHLSILGIGFEAGFSSKTTFNTTFKKMTGLSPSQYAQNAGDSSLSPSIG
jgi:AraC-like DNA-binding protein